MKKWMTGLAALLMLLMLQATAMAGVGDTVERACPNCGKTTTGTVKAISTTSGSEHGFIFECDSCKNTVEITEAHCGGGATCTQSAACAICGEEYTDPDNHPSFTYTIWDVDINDHLVDKTCNACGVTLENVYERHTVDNYVTEYQDEDEDTHWKIYRCRICNAWMSNSPSNPEPHTFSEATCVDSAACIYCGHGSGSLDSDNHDWSPWYALSSTQHIRRCVRDGCDAVEIESHTGGEATTTEPAVCEVCDSPYGGLLPAVTSPRGDTTVTVYEGERATMTITAVNAASYQWFMSTDGGTSWSECGEDSPTYTTGPAKMENSGCLYMCVVTGTTGQPDKEERPAEMALRSVGGPTDDGIPEEIVPGDGEPGDGEMEEPLMAESPVFTLEVIRKEAVPQTGDSSRPGLWLALGLISAAALAGIALRGGKKRTE